MAKPNRALKPQNKSASKLAGNLNAASRIEAQKLKDIERHNFEKGRRMAARARARAEGMRAGFKAGKGGR